jgi:mono/diheme cytochrome c family protein
MEYAPPANNQPGPFFTKFYVFDDEGDRTPIADLDQRGAKAVPGLCNVCHGGAPRPLLPNGKHDLGGNTGAGFIPWDLNNFRYSSDPAFTRDAQEEQFRKLNRAVLDTNPTEIANTVIRGWYGGGNQIDVSGTHWDGSFVPPGWKSPAAPPGSESLYLDFVAPYCRGCHLQRFDFERLPTAAQPLDFASHAEFIELAPRTIQQLFNAGTMPLARRTFEKMWSEADMNAFAAHLGVEMQRPGRPRAVVEAGFLDVQPGSLVTLSGALSLFASDFQWEFVATPGGSQASLFDAESDRAGFFADEEGSYIVKLTVGDGIAEDSTLAFVNVSASAPAPATFTTVRNDVFNKDCTGCHNANGDAKRLVLTQDSVPQGSDLYQRVLARVDPQGIVTSPLFRKPTASVLHGGGHRFLASNPTDLERGRRLQILYSWLARGAPND